MNWRSGLRVFAIALNGVFAIWLFWNAAVWNGDYAGGAVVAVPPIVAIIALMATRSK